MIRQQIWQFDQTLSTEPAPTAEDHLEMNLAAAESSFPAWSQAAIGDRAGIVRRAAQILHSRLGEFARLISLERQTSHEQAIEEVSLTIDRLQDYAVCTARMLAFLNLPSEPEKAWSDYRPIGIVAAVAKPRSDLPLYQLARFSCPHLMAGNAVIVQHTDCLSPSAIGFDWLWGEAGGPPGTYTNMELSSQDLERLARDPRVKRIVSLPYQC